MNASLVWFIAVALCDRLFARDCAFKISHETNEARNVKNNKDN